MFLTPFLSPCFSSFVLFRPANIFAITQIYYFYFYFKDIILAIPSCRNPPSLDLYVFLSLTSFESLVKSHLLKQFLPEQLIQNTHTFTSPPQLPLFFFKALTIIWHAIIFSFVYFLPFPVEHKLRRVDTYCLVHCLSSVPRSVPEILVTQ